MVSRESLSSRLISGAIARIGTSEATAARVMMDRGFMWGLRMELAECPRISLEGRVYQKLAGFPSANTVVMGENAGMKRALLKANTRLFKERVFGGALKKAELWVFRVYRGGLHRLRHP